MSASQSTESAAQTMTGALAVVTAGGVLTFALFPLALPILLLTAVFTLPLLLPLIPVALVVAIVLAIRAIARRARRRRAARTPRAQARVTTAAFGQGRG